jgi:hypothetical protein
MSDGVVNTASRKPGLSAENLTRGTLEAIAAQLSGMSYGSLLITVHDGRVVQLERTEKTRFF